MNQKILELSLIYAFSEYECKKTNGRIKGLYQRLIKTVYNELQILPAITDAEISAMAEKLNAFETQTGWNGENRHSATTASFCLEMIENSEFKYSSRITKTLIDIIDYFDRAGKVPGPSFWSGSVAAEKWIKIMAAGEDLI